MERQRNVEVVNVFEHSRTRVIRDIVQCPQKILRQFKNMAKSRYPQKSSHPMQYT